MDIFNVCWIALINEAKKFDLSCTENLCDISDSNVNDVDFKVPKNRLAYMYKLAPFNILYFQQCVMDFKDKCPDGQKMLNEICSSKKLSITSLSSGPGTDIIGLLHALFLSKINVKSTLSLKAINKYGEWGNIFQEMACNAIESTSVNNPQSLTSASDNVTLIECDILASLPSETELNSSDVIILMKAFASTKADVVQCANILKEILSFLKPGALVFFVDSQSKCKKFVQMNISGNFIYGPARIQLENIQFNETLSQIIGNKPIHSGFAYFAVWQKISLVDSLKPINKISTENLFQSMISDSSTERSTLTNKIYGNVPKVIPVHENEIRKFGGSVDISDDTEMSSSVSDIVVGTVKELDSISSSKTKRQRNRRRKKNKCIELKDSVANIVSEHLEMQTQENIIYHPVIHSNCNISETVQEIHPELTKVTNTTNNVSKCELSAKTSRCVKHFDNSTTKAENNYQVNTESINGKEKLSIENSFNSLLKHCDAVITNLEVLVADIHDQLTESHLMKGCSRTKCFHTQSCIKPVSCKNLQCGLKSEEHFNSSFSIEKCCCVKNVYYNNLSFCCQNNPNSTKNKKTCNNTNIDLLSSNERQPYIVIPLSRAHLKYIL